ncbi:hypothetical protein GDO78_001185 [Eleutherodactylus coqui]|uniref:Uncharacterized protein n=1 Tax=Eleutherodactylus coqui TaxID=57060 RepID=A0A8J6FS47_ELECQ|nr:hypothetical protein GDO78_001185 [Eleutherodactylus coqui]
MFYIIVITDSPLSCSTTSESLQALGKPPATKDPQVKRDCPESHSPSQNQQKSFKDSKLKRSHSTDVQSASHISKKLERRLSLNTSKSSSSSKEERRHSVSLPTSSNRNGSNKTSTNTKEERPSAPLACSPTCSSPPSSDVLSPSYVTGDSVRDKCVEMIASALKTDDDYKTFGVSCERIAWEIEECIYNEMKATDMKYRNRIRSRISNLKDPKNPSLRRNVLCGVVSAQNIATMTAEVQTRSADEPMTTFVLCNECGHRWKFC